MGRAHSRHRREKEYMQGFDGKARRPRHRWETNIKMDLRGIGWGGIDWIHVAQDRDQWQTLVNKVMNFHVT
jgi:hypothetical protein